MLQIAPLAVLTLVAAAVAHFLPGDRDGVVVGLGVFAMTVLVASAGLFSVAWLWRRVARLFGRRTDPETVPDTRQRIVVDGSNVMYWDRETPMLGTVTAVLDALIARGFAPVVFFDANVGYRLFDAFHGPDAMQRRLPDGLAEVVVVGAGDPADPALIARALDTGARIVSNDRFRDWRGQFPALGEKGVLVSGEMRGGAVRLRM